VKTVSGRYAARSARIAFDDFERAAISSYTNSMSASDRGEWIVTPCIVRPYKAPKCV